MERRYSKESEIEKIIRENRKRNFRAGVIVFIAIIVLDVIFAILGQPVRVGPISWM